MTSYAKFITGKSFYRCDSIPWVTAGEAVGFLNYLKTLSAADQLRYILDQTLALSEMFWLYGPSFHEIASTYSLSIKDYTDNHLRNLTFDEIEQTMLTSVLSIQSNWYGASWTDIPVKETLMFLYHTADNEGQKKYPQALDQSCVAPYLLARNFNVSREEDQWVGDVSVPRISFNADRAIGYIGSYSVRIGTGFTKHISDKYPKELWGDIKKLEAYPFLMFMLRTDIKGENFESVLSNLAWLCPHYDRLRVLSSNFRLFYATQVILNDLFSVDFIDIALNQGLCSLEHPTWDEEPIRSALMTLLGILNKTRGVKMGRDMFVKFFGYRFKDKTQGTDLQKVVNYVRNSGANVASAEDRAAFERSPLAGTEAIDLISQRTPVLAQETGTDNAVEEQAGDEEGNLDLSDLPELDDAKPALEAENETAEEDEDTTTDGDGAQGEDDSSSGEGGEGDKKPNKPEEDNASQDANSTGDDNQQDAGDTSVAPAETANDTQAGSNTPEDIDASDDEGITFKIAPEGSETVDSVMIREELDKFVSDILINPPKELSPQTISALTTLQKNWIHILSMETIVGILEKLVVLPDRIKEIKTNMENKNHE